jgi:hypothetical protein
VSLLLVRAEQSSGHQSFAHHVGLTRLWKAAERVWDSHPLNLPKPNESGKWGGMRYALTSRCLHHHGTGGRSETITYSDALET